MRTTLTLEPDVARDLMRRIDERGITLKQAVNDALRYALATSHRPSTTAFNVEPHHCRPKAGIDLDKLGQLADELEVREAGKKLAR